MRLKIRGKGNPRQGQWKITDADTNEEVLCKSIRLDIDHDAVKGLAELIEYPDLDVELDVELQECGRDTAHIITAPDGTKWGMCFGHTNTARIFAQLVDFPLQVKRAPGRPEKCMTRITDPRDRGERPDPRT